MAAKSKSIGPLTIYPPGRGLQYFWFSHDLARLFGVARHDAAMETLKRALAKTSGLGAKNVDVELEGEAITVRARTPEALVSAVRVTFELARKNSRAAIVDESEYAALLRAFGGKEAAPKEQAFSVGDFFAISLQNGEHAFGWVLKRRGVSITSALFDYRSADTAVDPKTLATATLISIVDFLADPLIYGEWPVVGRAPLGLGLRFSLWRRGDRDLISGGSGTFEALANAWHGLTPWNVEDGFEFALRRGVSRPASAKVLSPDARLKYRTEVGLDNPIMR